MDKLITYPTRAKIYGNIIGDTLGYIHSLDDFESKQCEVEMLPAEVGEFNHHKIYGIRLIKNLQLFNHFSEPMQYCTYDNQDNIFVCEHMNQGELVDEILYSIGIGDIFDITEYSSGYTFTVKNDYLEEFEIENPEDETETVLADDVESWFLLVHDSGEIEDDEGNITTEYGVPIPSGVSTANYSFDFLASLDLDEIYVGFVFMDSDGIVIGDSVSDDPLVNNNIGDGTLIDAEENKYRNRQQYVATIPNGASFISPMFKLPKLIYPEQWIRINKNCMLFDNPYINFVRG